MVNTFKPTNAESVRHISPGAEDRKKDLEQFKERKKTEQSLKEGRFARMRENWKRRRSGGGKGINIEISGD